MILLVTDIDQTQGICGDAPGVAKLSIDGTLASKRPDKMSTSIENLNPMVVSVSNDVLANLVHCHTSQTVKFAFSIAITAKAESVLALLIKDLHSVIGRVGHHDRVVGAHCNASRPGKKAWLAASRAESQEETLLVVQAVDLVIHLLAIRVFLAVFVHFGPIFVFQIARPRAQIVVIGGQASSA